MFKPVAHVASKKELPTESAVGGLTDHIFAARAG